MAKNSIDVLPKYLCTGCKMCGDICPTHSITFREDGEGFFYPVVDDDSCVGCGLCNMKCPSLNLTCNEKSDVAMSAFASDVKAKESGSSGGVFYLLASYVLKNCGVVYGAAFDGHLKLRHHRVDRFDNIRMLCKSKYLQSDCSDVYSQVRADLIDSNLVLFVGTPCQCQALKNFIGEKLSEKLILVDFVCHGVPSQELFDENLKWNESKYGPIKSVEFRFKDKNVKHPHTLKMVYEKDGVEYTKLRLHYQDPFYFGFQKHLTLRPSCYRCQWAKPERCSDITLADFWGIEKANLGLDSKNGVSCILLNSNKGKKIYASIEENLEGVNQLPIAFAVKNNVCLDTSTVEPKNREQFFTDWKTDGYDAVVKKYLTPSRKWMFDLYYAIPTPLRKIVRELMDNRMKYE